MTIDEAREIAAQCWCHPTTDGIEMDSRLAEVFAQTLYEHQPVPNYSEPMHIVLRDPAPDISDF